MASEYLQREEAAKKQLGSKGVKKRVKQLPGTVKNLALDPFSYLIPGRTSKPKKPRFPGPGTKPAPLTPRTPGVPGKKRPDMGYGPGRKPYPGNDSGPVRPRPLPKPVKPKPKKRGM